MALLLAPVEALLDFTLRDALTRVGGLSRRCVSELIRVTDAVLPAGLCARHPELRQGSRTAAGVVRATPVGSTRSAWPTTRPFLALGPAGIDLNFGCPAKVVNRHGGGAALLQEPDLVRRPRARSAPCRARRHEPVSAKMRLGLRDDAQAEDCARAMPKPGPTSWSSRPYQGRRLPPPAYWERIADVKACVASRWSPMAGWTVADARRCIEVSGCTDLMLGRGVVADPGLALAILADQGFTRMQPSTHLGHAAAGFAVAVLGAGRKRASTAHAPGA